MIRRLSSRLSSRLRSAGAVFGVWLLCSPWPRVVRAPRGRFARARFVWERTWPDGSSSFRFFVGPWVVLGDAPLPLGLGRLAFWLTR